MAINPSLPEPSSGIPRRFCDLVMKGGITSGIVYPKAVCELASEFTFRNIGGNSAGPLQPQLPQRQNSDASAV